MLPPLQWEEFKSDWLGLRRRLARPLDLPRDQPIPQKRQDDRAVDQRRPVVGLDQQIVVNHPHGRDQIDQPVQAFQRRGPSSRRSLSAEVIARGMSRAKAAMPMVM